MSAAASPATSPRVAQAWAVLAQIPDPEVPAVTLCDLGMVRSVQESGDVLEVALTPTYSGCPATEMIEQSVVEGLQSAGLGPVQVKLQRAPAWTTEWITPEGRDKLRAYGIAPPGQHCAKGREAGESVLRFVRSAAEPAPAVPCSHCGSSHTVESSHFGSTACKALYKCLDCQEPFDYFKPY